MQHLIQRISVQYIKSSGNIKTQWQLTNQTWGINLTLKGQIHLIFKHNVWHSQQKLLWIYTILASTNNLQDTNSNYNLQYWEWTRLNAPNILKKPSMCLRIWFVIYLCIRHKCYIWKKMQKKNEFNTDPKSPFLVLNEGFILQKLSCHCLWHIK